MMKNKMITVVLIILIALTGFISCDFLSGGDSGNDGELTYPTLAVDVNQDYFTTIGSSSVDVYINDVKVGTIKESDLGSSWEYSPFTFNYTDSISSLRFVSGTYSDTFVSISDFASFPPTSITSIDKIKKVVLYPSQPSPSYTVDGTGAYIGPKKPSFTTSSATENSICLSVTEDESPTNLAFNVYLSTDGGLSFTKHNSTAIDATEMYDGYIIGGLARGTDYKVSIEAVYDGIISVKSSVESFTTDGTKWTVMVWLDGDNNLNPAAVVDFHEMEHGLYLASQSDSDITDKLNIIVQYDQNSSYDSSSSTHGIYKILPQSTVASNTTTLASTSTQIATIGEPNMGSAQELADFIDYTKIHYPAKNYALILWNHGGGVRSIKDEDILTKAICWDDTNGDDALYIGEIKDYLDSTHSVDFLGMDACLMGFLEVAYEYRPGTDDFGADAISFSPASEQGDGWEYDAIFSRLSGQSGTDSNGHSYYDIDSLTAQEFATVVAQEYGDAWSLDSWETQTAVDLTKIASVKTAADGFASAIKSYQAQVENIRGAVGYGNLMAYFDESDVDEWYAYAGFDLYELAEQVKENITDSSVAAAADTLMDAVDDAVLYSFGSSSYDSYYGTGYYSGKNGLAIFFPDGDEAYGDYPYWRYQHWYNGVSHDEYIDWATSIPNVNYGALDFCTSDGDGIVESWFELLQYWFNDSITPIDVYNPSPKE